MRPAPRAPRAPRSRRGQRGTTLLEAMAAMSVMLIGSLGLVGLNTQAVKMNGDAQRMARAAAIAEDLTSQIALWPYGDPRLANALPSNDADIGDSAFLFEQPGPPPADHGEADLTLNNTLWLGIPTADVTAGGYERYWNVSYVDDSNGNGVWDAVRIAVIVRWPSGGEFRRVVMMSTKTNPAEEK